MSEDNMTVEETKDAVGQETAEQQTSRVEELNKQAREQLAANNWEAALDLYRQVLTLMEEADDAAGKAEALNNIASVYLARREWTQALETLEPALQLLKEPETRKRSHHAQQHRFRP